MRIGGLLSARGKCKSLTVLIVTAAICHVKYRSIHVAVSAPALL